MIAASAMLGKERTPEVNGIVSGKQFGVGYEETPASRVMLLRGELDLSAAAYFRSIIEPVLAQFDKTLVFDMRDLTYMDSTGIGIVIFALKARADHPGSFRIEQIPGKIRRLFDLTGISRFLDGAGDGGR